MPKINYKPLSEEIDSIIGDFAELNYNKALNNETVDDELDALAFAFNGDCKAHLDCHATSLLFGECKAFQVAFIMGILVERKKGQFKREVVELFNLYQKEG